jgi:hypothetical protein
MAVPWLKIIQWAPQIITLSRELLNRSRTLRPSENLVRAADATDIPSRVVALEENERRQAELVDKMAAQQADMARAITALHKRQRWLIATVLLLGVALLWQVFWR